MEKEMDSIKLIEPSFYFVNVFWINKEKPGHQKHLKLTAKRADTEHTVGLKQPTKQSAKCIEFLGHIDCKHNFIIIVAVSGESFYEIIKINYRFIHSCFEQRGSDSIFRGQYQGFEFGSQMKTKTICTFANATKIWCEFELFSLFLELVGLLVGARRCQFWIFYDSNHKFRFLWMKWRKRNGNRVCQWPISQRADLV